MPPEKQTDPDAVEKARQEGYEQAKAEFDLANRKPLFETCRDYVKEHWLDSDQSLLEAIDRFEDEYGYDSPGPKNPRKNEKDEDLRIKEHEEREIAAGRRLIPQDRRLCLAQKRRMQMEAEKAKLKRETGSITEYQVVQ